MRKLIYTCIGSLFVLVSWVHAQEEILGTEAQQAAGKQLYDKYCSQCHGYNGDANSVGKKYYRPEPRDFTSGTFKFRTTESGELPSHDDITRSIKNGMPYTGMPPWPTFSNDELDDLAYYLKTFSDDFVDFGDVTPITISDPPSITDESIQRGRVVFEENQCIDCHGNQGRGDGPSTPTLKDQWEQPIRAADLTKRWTFRGGASRKDIYRTFTTGLDGSPMPSYAIDPPEDQWNLVNYVYSLSESDEAQYGTLVVAEGVQGEIDLKQADSQFQNVNKTMLPIVGQIIEPGRQFFPGVNAIDVKAIYDRENIAIQLTWHDMSAETGASNSPSLPTSLYDANVVETEEFNDAVAIQFPSQLLASSEKPYFMFGDSKNSVDIWFADLGKNSADFYVGNGSKNIEKGESDLEIFTNFDEGKWTVIFKSKKIGSGGLSFEEERFVPISFSVWDGFNKERGNNRGLTSWYYLYLQPMEIESAVGPMAKYAMITLLAELGLVFFVRIRYKGKV